MGQLGIRIINIALFTASCFFTAGVVNHVAESQLAPDYVSAFQPAPPSEPRQATWEERRSILDRNLFGAQIASAKDAVEEAPPPPLQEEAAQETKLPIQLLGTMAGQPASLSTAVINDTRAKKHQVVRIGDTLKSFDHVTVTSIEPRRVLLRNRTVVEELLLVKKEIGSKTEGPKAALPGKRNQLQRLRDRRSRNSRKKDKPPEPPANQTSMPQLGSALTANLLKDVKPEYDATGNVTGVHIGNIAPDSPLAKAGLEADDVIVSLNGLDIDSAGAARRVYREIAKCKPVSGTVRGASGTRPLEIENPCALK
jgi:type II secretory pathway component PulC